MVGGRRGPSKRSDPSDKIQRRRQAGRIDVGRIDVGISPAPAQRRIDDHHKPLLHSGDFMVQSSRLKIDRFSQVAQEHRSRIAADLRYPATVELP
jgi:hypothetical protein